MRIGLIGSGKVGRALGAWMTRVGDEVAFTSRTQEHALEAARDAGPGATALEVRALVEACGILLLTRPFTQIVPSLEPLREVLAGQLLVDVTNSGACSAGARTSASRCCANLSRRAGSRPCRGPGARVPAGSPAR